MATRISIKTFFELNKEISFIDVRTPSEFKQGHIPGAINIPIFSDSERVEIGTAYKHNGKISATLIGLEKVGPKMRILAEQAIKYAKDGKLLVHCWRGGMRSESMAWLFEKAGVECFVLNGGYKAYRRYAKNQLSRKSKMIILSGSTGSGKTDILKALQSQGEQIIDLEGLAHHKGSAFGSIGEPEQVSTEQFENNLYHEYAQLELNKPIWVEDESRSIGKNFIPEEFYVQMRNAQVLKISLPKEVRVKRLVEEYTHTDKEVLIFHLNRIKKRLGPNQTKLSIEAVEKNDMTTAVDLTLSFYDKAYEYGLSKRNIQSVFYLDLKKDHPLENAQKILEFAQQKIYNSLI